MELFEGLIKAINKAKKRKRELDRGEVNADSTDTERQNIGKGREILNKSTNTNWANSLNKAGKARREGFKNQAKSHLKNAKAAKGPKLENKEITEMTDKPNPWNNKDLQKKIAKEGIRKERLGYKKKGPMDIKKLKVPKGVSDKGIVEVTLSEKVCMVIKQLGSKAKKKKVNEVYSRLLNLLKK